MRTTTSRQTAALRWGGLALGAAFALAACSGGTGAGSADGGGSGDKATTIKLVAAEYSKDNTKAFWDKFATAYKAKTGNTLEVQIVSWDDIDQQSSHDGPEQQPAGHPQPQRLRELRQGRPALQRRRRAVRLGEVRPARRLRQVAAPTTARCTACRT